MERGRQSEPVDKQAIHVFTDTHILVRTFSHVKAFLFIYAFLKEFSGFIIDISSNHKTYLLPTSTVLNHKLSSLRGRVNKKPA